MSLEGQARRSEHLPAVFTGAVAPGADQTENRTRLIEKAVKRKREMRRK
jgi:hypothetical protein